MAALRLLLTLIFLIAKSNGFDFVHARPIILSDWIQKTGATAMRAKDLSILQTTLIERIPIILVCTQRQ